MDFVKINAIKRVNLRRTFYIRLLNLKNKKV